MNRIESMKYAGQVNRAAIEYGFEIAKPGMSKLDLGNRLGDFIHSHNCEPAFRDYLGFPGDACICLTEEIVHGIPNGRIIEDGDILTIDIGTKFQGWNVDAAMTDIIGRSTTERLKFVRDCEAIFKVMIKHINPNFSLFQLAELGDKLTSEKGLFILNDFCGHGIGMTIHMEPNIFHSLKGLNDSTIRLLKTTFLTDGTMICVEPIFIPHPNIGHQLMSDGWTWASKYNLMSAHFEHTLLITENGVEIIS